MSPVQYGPEYESVLMRGVEDPHPWDLAAEVEKLLTPANWLLDVGCGTMTKVLPFAAAVQQVVGVDPSLSMLVRARTHKAELGLHNVMVAEAKAGALPFADDSFDIATSMLAPDDAHEAHRVLRPGGYTVVEKLGESDKAGLKAFFGEDDQGPRGQLSDLQPGERLRLYKDSYGELFSIVLAVEGFWDTFYTREGLEVLLRNTSVIRSFDATQDAAALDAASEALMTPRGICAPQHRLLIIARKS